MSDIKGALAWPEGDVVIVDAQDALSGEWVTLHLSKADAVQLLGFLRELTA